MGADDDSMTDHDPMKRRQFLASAAALAGSCSAVGAQLAPMLERLTVARVGTARAAELGSAVLRDLDRAAISSPRTVALLEPVCGTGS